MRLSRSGRVKARGSARYVYQEQLEVGRNQRNHGDQARSKLGWGHADPAESKQMGKLCRSDRVNRW